jgi:RNA-binding protein
MAGLTSKQRQFLKARAHGLAPVVRVGKGGLTKAVAAETATALRAHELIKVRIDVEDGAERRALAQELAASADAHLAGAVGKVAILYRAREKDPGIRLPIQA